MQTFKLKQDQFNKFKRALIIRTTPLLLIPVVVIVIFTGHSGTVLAVLIPMFLGIIIFGLWNSVKKQKKVWETFKLIIDDNKLERIQEGFPTISILKSDVVEAIEATNGALTIIAKPKSNSIIIPFAIENKEELLKLILSFTTIRKAKNKYSLLTTYGAGFLGPILFLSFMLSTDFYFTLVLGLTMIGLLLWGFIEVQRGKSFDKKMKRSSYVIFILILVVISKLVTAWGAYGN